MPFDSMRAARQADPILGEFFGGTRNLTQPQIDFLVRRHAVPAAALGRDGDGYGWVIGAADVTFNDMVFDWSTEGVVETTSCAASIEGAETRSTAMPSAGSKVVATTLIMPGAEGGVSAPPTTKQQPAVEVPTTIGGVLAPPTSTTIGEVSTSPTSQAIGGVETSAMAALVFVARDAGGDPLDLVAWAPRSDRTASRFGRAAVLGEQSLRGLRIGAPANAHRNVIAWLRAGRDGVVLIDPRRAGRVLIDMPERLVAEDEAHAAEIAAMLRRCLNLERIVVPVRRAA